MKDNNENGITAGQIFVFIIFIIVLIGMFKESGGNQVDENKANKNESRAKITRTDKVQICKQYIGALFGRDHNSMDSEFTKDDAGATFVQVSYTRQDDNKKWAYVCFINDNSIVWAAVVNNDLGRWRWEDEGRISTSKNNDRSVTLTIKNSKTIGISL